MFCVDNLLAHYFQGFTAVVPTSRRIRVGTRIYLIGVHAVSKEHVPGCITRKVTNAENGMVFVLASRLTWLLCWLEES